MAHHSGLGRSDFAAGPRRLPWRLARTDSDIAAGPLRLRSRLARASYSGGSAQPALAAGLRRLIRRRVRSTCTCGWPAQAHTASGPLNLHSRLARADSHDGDSTRTAARLHTPDSRLQNPEAAGGGGLVVVAAGGGGMAAGACHGGGLAARFAPCSVARLASRSMAKSASLSKAASSRIRCTVAACSASTMLLAWGDLS